MEMEQSYYHYISCGESVKAGKVLWLHLSHKCHG